MNSIPNRYSLKNQRHVGIDVGKSVLDIQIYELNLHWQAGNDSSGIKSLLTKLRCYKLTRVLVEATGGSERVVPVASITEWQRAHEILKSVPGIGDGVAFTCRVRFLS